MRTVTSVKMCMMYILDLVKYSESRVHEVEHNVKYLRRENEELKLDCEILRDQVNQITGHSRKGSLTDPESNGSQISRFEFQENSGRRTH